MSDYEFLVDYLSKNLKGLTYGCTGGPSPEFPKFELMPFDYLEFAEQELSINSNSSKIGCVSNLKRATECEMDTFLYMLGLTEKIKGFPKKLEFISKAGLLSPRSLTKLNRIRNKMEHEYSVPEIGELESYFDLASGFVHAMEGYIFMLTSHSEQEWVVGDIYGDLAFNVALQRKPAKILFEVFLEKEKRVIEFTDNNLDNYASALKIFFLLCRATGLLSNDYIVAKLTETPVKIGSGRY
jgi:hypothetical protein